MGSISSRLHRKQGDSSFKPPRDRVVPSRLYQTNMNTEMRRPSHYQLPHKETKHIHRDIRSLSLIGANTSKLRDYKSKTSQRRLNDKSSRPKRSTQSSATTIFSSSLGLQIDDARAPSPEGLTVDQSQESNAPQPSEMEVNINYDMGAFRIPFPDSPPPPPIPMETKPWYLDITDVPPPLPPRPMKFHFKWNEPYPEAIELANECRSKYGSKEPISRK